MARLCGICADPRGDTIDNFMRKGLPYSKFRAKFNFSKSCWGRHKHHLAQRAEAAVEADERRTGGAVPAEEKDFREINRRLRTLAARATKAGRVAYAINAYAAISRNLEAMQRLGAKGAGSELPPPVVTVVFRTVEEVEAARLKARDEIRAADPGNAVLQETAADAAPQPRLEPAEKLDEELRRWAELGKDLPN